MKLFRLIVVVTLIFFVQVTLAQVSNAEGIKPLEGVTIPKVSSTQSLAPGAVFKDCNECPEMVVIPAESFLMGSPPDLLPDPFSDDKPVKIGNDDEKPQHQVQITSFAIGKYEVTQEQYHALMGVNPSRFKGRTLPVEQVSWDDAQEFINKLSAKTGKNYRLPSEAEWEYAARAGSTTEFSFGNDPKQLAEYAWFGQNSGDKTHPVGLKKPNSFGLYDMHGNVWEWTQDCWNKNYYGAPTDGSAWTKGDCSLRVVRGGSQSYAPPYLRSVRRSFAWSTTTNRFGFGGFRIVRDN
jgi:formylglycine-generating enzyme required for sulfatase activity